MYNFKVLWKTIFFYSENGYNNGGYITLIRNSVCYCSKNILLHLKLLRITFILKEKLKKKKNEWF